MTAHKPEVVITYCTQCQWLLRAAWLAQELLSTFADDLGKVSLVPGTEVIYVITYRNVGDKAADVEMHLKGARSTTNSDRVRELGGA